MANAWKREPEHKHNGRHANEAEKTSSVAKFDK